MKRVTPSAGWKRQGLLALLTGDGAAEHAFIERVLLLRSERYPVMLTGAADASREFARYTPAIARSGNLFHEFAEPEELFGMARPAPVVAAASLSALPDLREIAGRFPGVATAFYVRHASQGEALQQATRPGGALEGMWLYSDSVWLCETLRTEHGLAAAAVAPGVDRRIHVPPDAHRGIGPASIVAIMDEKGGAAERTARLLAALADRFGPAVTLNVIGSRTKRRGTRTRARQTADRWNGRFELSRAALANLLQQADIYVDLSDRAETPGLGLTAMACGCAAALPKEGAAGSFANHLRDALLLDTTDYESCWLSITALVEDRGLRERLQAAAATRAATFDAASAAQSDQTFFIAISLARLAASTGGRGVGPPMTGTSHDPGTRVTRKTR
ncbi:MAG: glycosyltransferase [Thermomicrobiales bacterium]